MKTGEVVAITGGAVALTALAVYLIEHHSNQPVNPPGISTGNVNNLTDSEITQIHMNVQQRITELLTRPGYTGSFYDMDTAKYSAFGTAVTQLGYTNEMAGNYQNYSYPGLIVLNYSNPTPGTSSQGTSNSSGGGGFWGTVGGVAEAALPWIFGIL